MWHSFVRSNLAVALVALAAFVRLGDADLRWRTAAEVSTVSQCLANRAAQRLDTLLATGEPFARTVAWDRIKTRAGFRVPSAHDCPANTNAEQRAWSSVRIAVTTSSHRIRLKYDAFRASFAPSLIASPLTCRRRVPERYRSTRSEAGCPILVRWDGNSPGMSPLRFERAKFHAPTGATWVLDRPRQKARL